MRSFTTADLPGRCKQCRVVEAHCVCASLPTVTPRTHVVIVRHLRESWKSTGTARIATLAMPSATCLDYGEDTQPAAAELERLVEPGTWVLLPTDEPQPWQPTDIRRLIAIDGTWRQARRMYQRLPMLHGLPRLTLTQPPRQTLRLRDTTFAEGRSTLEAVAEALGAIEGPEVEAPLLQAHDLFVERVLKARGVWEQRQKLHTSQAKTTVISGG